MRDRLLAALLFGGASAAFWIASALFPLVGMELAVHLGGASTISATVVAALTAPKLADSGHTGGRTGVVVTLGAFVLGAFLFAFTPLLFGGVMAPPGGYIAATSGVAWLFLIGLLLGGVLFLLPALLVGVLVGRLYLKLRPRSSTGAV